MKKALLVILLLAPLFAWAEKPNPTDYTTDIHVQSSRLVMYYGDVTQGSSVNSWTQDLSAVIGGKKYELLGSIKGTYLLRVGSYKAKILKEETKGTYEYDLTYQFLFPDGTTRNYLVVGEQQ